MKTLVLMLAMSAVVMAETQVYFVPGPWSICEAVKFPWCTPSEATKGHETYMLMVKSDNPLTVGYSYRVTGRLRDTGRLVTAEGTVTRADERNAATVVVLEFGGIIVTDQTMWVIKDLYVGSVSTSNN
jgi:hypothetical protein